LHLERLYQSLRKTLLSQPLIHGDETTVQVLKEPGKTAQSQSYMWLYRSGQDSAEPVVLFDYQPGRGKQYLQTFLADYKGMVMSDGYSAWRAIKGVTHFGCLAHARRGFVEVLKTQKKPGKRAQQALEFFQRLYRVEALAREKPPSGETRAAYTLRLRQQHSVPLLEAFKARLDEQAPQVPPESSLGNAISYTLNQWEYLSRYVADGRAPVDNNIAERDIRPFAMGRSLCTSFRNLDKHRDLSVGIVATRAMFACQRRRNSFALQIACPDLPWGVRHHLLGRQHSLLDQTADHVTGYAKAFRCLEHR
jgi:hypothetical protein